MYSCQISMKLQFYRQIFGKKILIYEISWKYIQWEPSCPMRTDGQTEERTDWQTCCITVRGIILRWLWMKCVLISYYQFSSGPRVISFQSLFAIFAVLLRPQMSNSSASYPSKLPFPSCFPPGDLVIIRYIPHSTA